MAKAKSQCWDFPGFAYSTNDSIMRFPHLPAQPRAMWVQSPIRFGLTAP